MLMKDNGDDIVAMLMVKLDDIYKNKFKINDDPPLSGRKLTQLSQGPLMCLLLRAHRLLFKLKNFIKTLKI